MVASMHDGASNAEHQRRNTKNIPHPRNNAPKMHCTIVIAPTRHQQRCLSNAYQSRNMVRRRKWTFQKSVFPPKIRFFENGIPHLKKSFLFPIYANFCTYVLKGLTLSHYAVLSGLSQPSSA